MKKKIVQKECEKNLLRWEKNNLNLLFAYFVPRLLHFRWPGTNFVAAEAACNRSDPAHPLAGDKERAATPVTSPTDSLLLLDDGTGEFGSSFIDNLKIVNKWIQHFSQFQFLKI